MTPETVMTVAQRALEITLLLSAPLLLTALLVGLLVGIFQAATQINEMTLSFIPKLLGMAAAIVVASVLMSMGMMMVPPASIALPFKLMLFVLADGWNLLIGSLVASFNP